MDTSVTDCLKKFPTKKYNVIYADPPWSYKNAGSNLSGTCDYPTMTFEELTQLPVKEISAKNCALFMWVTGPHLPTAVSLIQNWGFDYKTIFKVWRKLYKSGNPVCAPGWWSRSSVELLLVASKGTPLKLWKTTNNEPQEYASIREEHSKKPEEIRKSIEDFLDTDLRLELFSRTESPLWDSWGLDVPGYFRECNSVSHTTTDGKFRNIGTQCETDIQQETVKANNTKTFKKRAKPAKGKINGGFSHHRSDCGCFICKKVRLRASNNASTSSSSSGTS